MFCLQQHCIPEDMCLIKSGALTTLKTSTENKIRTFYQNQILGVFYGWDDSGNVIRYVSFYRPSKMLSGHREGFHKRHR